MGLVDRTLLQSYFQSPGQVYDDAMTEGAIDVLADTIDSNFNYASGLVSSGVLTKLGWYNVMDYGAEGDGVTDDTDAIQEAINNAHTAALLTSSMTVVSLGGKKYLTTSPLQIKDKVLLTNGTIVNNSLTDDQAIIYMGNPEGGGLVRPAGITDVRVETTSTASGAVGFRMDSLVRSSWFKNCFANMNEASDGSRGHIGFEIISTTIANATGGGVGAYQNLIENCTGMNCYSAFRIKTRGTDAEAKADPQANGNRITDCNAYSCYHSALIIGYGGNENICRGLRADTFDVGTSTDIAVVDVYGNYNYAEIHEEVGSISSGTQYTVRFRTDAIYNHVDYSTQNIVTSATIDDNSVPKNTSKFVNRLDYYGGEMSCIDHYTYTAIGTSVTQDIRHKWVAPKKCIVLRCVARLDANTTTSFDVYFAKNASFTTGNRIRFSTGEGTTAKSMGNDPTASTAINSQWLLNTGDQIALAFTNGAGETNKAACSFLVRYVE